MRTCALIWMLAVVAFSQTPTTTTLSVSPSGPLRLGQTVTLTATVAPAQSSGTVTFIDNYQILGSAFLSSGQASFQAVLRNPGRRRLRAVFNGTVSAARSLSADVIVRPVSILPKSLTFEVPFQGHLIDVNADGWLDQITMPSPVVKLAHPGGLTFGPEIFSNIPVPVKDYADYNNDGKVDALVQDGRNVWAVAGSGGGHFTTTRISPQDLIMPEPGLPWEVIGIGPMAAGGLSDLNRDGYADLSGSYVTGYIPTVHNGYYFGAGSGTFAVAPNSFGAFGSILDDLNSDGVADLTSCNYFSGTVLRTITDCHLRLSTPAGYVNGLVYYSSFPSVGSTSLFSGDFNGDGKQDLLDPPSSRVRYGNGDGSFGEPVQLPADSFIGFDIALVADFDGDGLDDVAGPAYGSAEFVFAIFKNGAFSRTIVPGQAGRPIDINADGILDLLSQDRVFIGSTSAVPATGPVLPSNPTFSAGVPQTLTFSFSDPDGGDTLAHVYLWLGSDSCSIDVDVAARTLMLAAATQAPAGWLFTTECAIDSSNLVVTASGPNLTVTLPVILFRSVHSDFVINTRAVDAGRNDTGYQNKGSITLISPVNQPPVIGAVTLGSGVPATVTATISDPESARRLQEVWFVVGTNSDPANACFVSVYVNQGAILLANDAGTNFTYSTFDPGGSTELANSQCRVSRNVTVTYNSVNQLTVSLTVSFAAGFLGNKTLFMRAFDTERADSGMKMIGPWNPAASIAAVSIQPSAGAGFTQTFSTSFFNAQGGADIRNAYLLIAPRIDGNAGCFVRYDGIAKQFSVLSGSSWSLSGAGPFCSLAANAAAQLSGNTLTLQLPLSLAPSLAGAQNVYLLAEGSAGATGWSQLGTWTVPGVATGPSVLSLTPNAGTGTAATYTGVFSHTGGANQLYLAYMLFLPTPNVVQYTATGSCLIEYNRISNGIRLINDAGDNWLGPVSGVPISPAAQPLSNTHCTVDVKNAQATLSGSTMSVTVPVSFGSGFTGLLATFLQAQDVTGLWTGMTQMGVWKAYPAITNKPGPYVYESSPTTGAGSSDVILTTVGHTAGMGNLTLVNLLVASSITGTPGCHIVFWPATDVVNLINDSGTAMVSADGLKPGSGVGTLSNSRCTVHGFGLTRTTTTSVISLITPVSYNAAAFAGPKKIYVNAFDAGGLLTHWVETGTWTVQ